MGGLCLFVRQAGDNMQDIHYSLLLSAIVVAFLSFSGAAGELHPFFLIALFALSQAGFFALVALEKAGAATPWREYVFIMMVFVCFAAVCLAYGSLRLFFPLFFMPVAFCTPAMGTLLRHYLQ